MAKAKRGRTQRPAVEAGPRPKRPRAPDWIVLGIAGLGLLITAYLSAVALWGTAPALCAEGSGCDIVQGSRWSRLFGIPVALFGFGLYAVIALTAFFAPDRPRRWDRLMWLALIGLAISLYLTAVGWFALEATCAWCMASLACLIALVGVLAWRRPATAPALGLQRFALSAGFAVAVTVGAMAAYHSEWLQPPEDPRLRALAEHLDTSGAVYYGTFWCPNCQQQRRLFGAAARHLPYVECSPNGRRGSVAFECVSNEVKAYPTWIIRGKRYEEVLQPQMLARYSGFNWEARAPR